MRASRGSSRSIILASCTCFLPSQLHLKGRGVYFNPSDNRLPCAAANIPRCYGRQQCGYNVAGKGRVSGCINTKGRRSRFQGEQTPLWKEQQALREEAR